MRQYKNVKCDTCGEDTTIVKGERSICELCAKIDGVKRSKVERFERYADENILHE